MTAGGGVPAPRGVERSGVWYLILLLVMLGWGTVYPLSKYIVDTTGPLLLSFLRYFLATIPLIPFVVMEIRRASGREKGRLSINPRDLLGIALIGVFGIAGFSTLMYFGVELSTATNSSLLVNTQPIIATLAAPLIVGEHFTLGRLSGAIIGVTGMFFVVTGGDFSAAILKQDYLLGNLLLIGASAAMAFYGILIKRYVHKYGSLRPTFITMLVGCVFLLIPLLVRGIPAGFLESITGWEVVLLLYLGAGGTAFTFLMFNRAVSHTGVVTAMGFKLFIPVFGTVLSIILLGERPGGWVYLGMIIIILSVFLIRIKEKSEKETESTPWGNNIEQ
ncbi:MAG: DMT family transporter [Spirochaetaceae bacterium]